MKIKGDSYLPLTALKGATQKMEDPMLHIFCEECHHSNDISTETTCYNQIDFTLKNPSTELTYRAVEQDPLVCHECKSCNVSRELYDHAKDDE